MRCGALSSRGARLPEFLQGGAQGGNILLALVPRDDKAGLSAAGGVPVVELETRLAQRLFAFLAERQKDLIGLDRMHQQPAGRTGDLLREAVRVPGIAQPHTRLDVRQELSRDVPGL